MIIYLDMIILINLIFNFLLLLLTKYLARETIPLYRLFIGTLIATTLVPLVIYFPTSFIQTFVGKSLYSILIIVATFGIRNIQQVITNVFLFYFISFSVGGGLFGLHYLLKNSGDDPIHHYLLNVNNIYGDQVSLLLLLIGFPIILFFTKSRMDRHVKEKIKYDQLYEVTIEMNGAIHRTTGFVDSGNQLNDPLTNRPVVICDEVFLEKFFSKEDWRLLRDAIVQEKLDQFPHAIKNLISIVPYQGVGGNSNYLFTIRPDKLTVLYNNQLLETKSVLIGIQLANLTSNQRYHCLLHPEIIQLSSVRTA